MQVLVIFPLTNVLFLRPRRYFSVTDAQSREHFSQIMHHDLCRALNGNECELWLFSLHDAFHHLSRSNLA